MRLENENPGLCHIKEIPLRLKECRPIISCLFGDTKLKRPELEMVGDALGNLLETCFKRSELNNFGKVRHRFYAFRLASHCSSQWIEYSPSMMSFSRTNCWKRGMVVSMPPTTNSSRARRSRKRHSLRLRAWTISLPARLS